MAGNAQLLELFLEGDLGPISDQAREAIAVMLRSNVGMQHYLQMLVDLFQLESNKSPLAIEEVDLTSVIENAREQLEPGLRERIGINVSAGACKVAADNEGLEKLFFLLLAYSLKSKNADAQLQVTVAETAANVKVTIEGALLSLGKIGSVDEFRALCSSAGRRKLPAGAALALHLCSLIVEAHKGEMQAEEGADQSCTTFSIMLPREPQ